MARRQLLTDDERRLLFGAPSDRDALVRHYTLTRSDRDLVATRRGDPNQLGFAVQLALLRHLGLTLAQVVGPADALVDWMATQLNVPAASFARYVRRPQTVTDHARKLAGALGLRPSTEADLPLMIEAAAQAAWSTDRGLPIVADIIGALRSERIALPAPAVIERVGIAGRARARKRTADALLAGLTQRQLSQIDDLLVLDPAIELTRLAWARSIPSSPKADHVRDLIKKLRFIRDIGIAPGAASCIHEHRFRQLVREGLASPAYLIDRYAAHRRRATVVALLVELEARLTDAVLDMADRLIGNAFTRAKNTKERRYVATTKDVGRLMRLFHRTIEALSLAQESERDALAVVDETVGWPRLLRARGEMLADLASRGGPADPCHRLLCDDPEIRAGLSRGSRVRGSQEP